MKQWTAWIAAFGALLLAVGRDGPAFVRALEAAFGFLWNLGSDAPLGVASFLLALALAVLGQAWLARFITARCARSREAILSAVGLGFGVGVMWAQLPTRQGLLLGLLAGFAAPFAFQLAAAAWGWVRRTAPVGMDP